MCEMTPCIFSININFSDEQTVVDGLSYQTRDFILALSPYNKIAAVAETVYQL